MIRKTSLVLSLLCILCPISAQEKGKTESIPLDFSDVKDREIARMLKEYQKPAGEFAWEMKLLKKTKKYNIYQVNFPSIIKTEHKPNNIVYCEYFVPKVGTKVPAVVMLHPLGGSFEMMQKIAKKFAKNKVAVLLLWMPYYGKRGENTQREMISPDIKETIEGFRQAVVDISRAYDWLACRNEVESSKIGIFGISLGAIVGSLTLGVDKRFSRSVLVIGGGDLAKIAVKHAKKMKGKIKLSYKELSTQLRSIEPLTFAFRVDSKNVYMVNAQNDEIIPVECTKKLWEAMGRPKIKWYKAGHISIFIFAGFIIKDAISFIKQKKRKSY